MSWLQLICWSLVTLDFTEYEVFSFDASEIDKIATLVLKNCAYILALPIHHLFITSIRSKTIATQL